MSSSYKNDACKLQLQGKVIVHYVHIVINMIVQATTTLSRLTVIS